METVNSYQAAIRGTEWSAEQLAAQNESPALMNKGPGYPRRFEGRVPKAVLLLQDVKSDLPLPVGPRLEIWQDEVYPVWVNSYGAVTAILNDGKRLGLKPNEFAVIEWHDK